MTSYSYLVTVATLALLVQIARLVLAVKTHRRRFPRANKKGVSD